MTDRLTIPIPLTNLCYLLEQTQIILKIQKKNCNTSAIIKNKKYCKTHTKDFKTNIQTNGQTDSPSVQFSVPRMNFIHLEKIHPTCGKFCKIQTLYNKDFFSRHKAIVYLMLSLRSSNNFKPILRSLVNSFGHKH